jgi:hypothetical protein
MMSDKTQRKTVTLDDKERRKLVDEVLLSKIDGEPTKNLQNLGLSVEDAIKLIKGDNTEKVLMDLQVEKYCGYNYPELGIGLTARKLRLEDLFQNQRYYKYATAKENVNSWKQQVNLAKKQKSMIKERLYNVAQDVRQSDDVKALKELLPLNITMHEYGGFEQTGSIGSSITRNDTQMDVAPGDIVLYNGNAISVFYSRSSWSYTRLGKIQASESELNSLLNKSSVTFTLKGE